MDKSLPWVEKYRPKTLDELVSHKDILNTINKFISQQRLPHLLFYGPPGTGKTSTILAVAKQLYKPSEINSMVLELNASDDRGIGIVRGQVLTFASTKTIFNKGFKLVILDEADAMTNDAQNALRRIMEKYTENTRFCIICNFLSKIIPPIQSRCTRFRFGPLIPSQILPRLEHVIQEEGVTITEDGKDALINLAGGDMRKVLNILQSTHLSQEKITEESIHRCLGHPLQRDIQLMLKQMLNEPFQQALQYVLEKKMDQGLALQDILTESHLILLRMEIPEKIKMKIIQQMAEIEYRLAIGTNEKLQLGSFVAAFQLAREQIVKTASQ